MKNITMISILSFLLISSSFAGEGAAGGGKVAITSNVTSENMSLDFNQVHSIETIDREIILRRDIKNIFKIENQRLIIHRDMMNVEIRGGEVIKL